MVKTWLTADPHFGHAGVCRFLRADGTKLRPWDDVEEMDKAMVQLWNEHVNAEDRVYILGDLAMSKRGMDKVLPLLKGRLVLIKGNHDIFKLKDYTRYFDDIRAYHIVDGMIMSHIPIHEDSLARFGTNIHGHLHAGRVTKTIPGPLWHGDVKVLDERYFCVSVEHTGFAPITLDEVKKRILAQGGTVGFKTWKEAVS